MMLTAPGESPIRCDQSWIDTDSGSGYRSDSIQAAFLGQLGRNFHLPIHSIVIAWRPGPQSRIASYLTDPIAHAPIRPDGLHFSALQCGLDSRGAMRMPSRLRSHLILASTSPSGAVERKFRPRSKSLSQSTRNGHLRSMRSFNTAGPVVAQNHYCIPPLERIDLEYVLGLIHDQKYFILHAPWQTGKTSTLKAIQDHLNSGAEGDYRCLHVNVEAAQAWREKIPEAMETILRVLAGNAENVLGDHSLEEIRSDVLAKKSPGTALSSALRQWAEADSRPLVLLIDEIDALIGDTLLSVLRQLRSGYDTRPRSFPHSIVLCGVRNVRDYPIHSSSEGEMIPGGSAFNISATSLRLGDFDRGEWKPCSVSTPKRPASSSSLRRWSASARRPPGSRGW